MLTFTPDLDAQLNEIRQAGLEKKERPILGAQGAQVDTETGTSLNFCANNYLGLANHPDIIAAAHKGLDDYGFGTASVRFICGTQDEHKALEREIAEYVGTEDAILLGSCFDANGALFDVLLGPEDAVISDELNHASIIDGIRLCKARRYRYKNRDMADLRAQLEAASPARRLLIVTDGVFSMDGYFAPLEEICDLAEEFGAAVVVDDSHATGFIGDRGAGTHVRAGVGGRVDILTGTLGKALGGASGGYIAGPAAVIELMRQHGRPYLFSNAVAPSLVAGARTALRLARDGDDLRARLEANARLFRTHMSQEGFDLLEGDHPIIAVMFPGEDGARQAGQIAAHMLANGVYVTPFSFPVVPRGKARIRVQLSAAHTKENVEACVAAFVAARDSLN